MLFRSIKGSRRARSSAREAKAATGKSWVLRTDGRCKHGITIRVGRIWVIPVTGSSQIAIIGMAKTRVCTDHGRPAVVGCASPFQLQKELAIFAASRRRTITFFPKPKGFGFAYGWPAFGRPAGGWVRWKEGSTVCRLQEEGTRSGRQRAEWRTKQSRCQNLVSLVHWHRIP